MAKTKKTVTSIRATRTAVAMLSILKQRAASAGNKVSFNDLIIYMIETQYPDVAAFVYEDVITNPAPAAAKGEG